MNIIVMSLVSFSVVIVTLGILAVMMRIITTIFPERQLVAPKAVDPAIVQAVGMAVTTLLPGSTVAKIEEIL
ncbi:MAG: hypothetical protein QMD32_02370, partial [Smithellaceae bacterium]|nr:hypothetical protein [Smithellaceae bacterium]